mmetsp:Transcript_60529/g.131155  ORF Transcript_60529/g.131155 Transcript_60529/m.131155 type:complete len:98 (-) Transcript_60529:448-741(-)|eukprot:CAMPEP_0170582068 /NCGR_PEP_ID=MMETSP0224-20130122/7381_1 /TAXON_ID=285029 /ORGANISM="Togula jolla, Strain CCCM 725" /LENGTH=97 /DNA_ID=CAMNT_0010905257 /DNA_START=410 /DNA_END=703 /DNA_ORIENTATION=-
MGTKVKGVPSLHCDETRGGAALVCSAQLLGDHLEHPTGLARFLPMKAQTLRSEGKLVWRVCVRKLPTNGHVKREPMMQEDWIAQLDPGVRAILHRGG